MVSLQEVITKNQNLFGVNFEHLGKNSNVYLSYDKTGGWSVEKFDGCLGFVRQIFRRLGFYASTHLKIVAAQLQIERDANPVLKAKISECWNRHTGKNLVAAAPLAARVVLPRVNEAQVRFVPNPQILNRIGYFIGDTHISIEQGDITQVRGVTAIVNAANEACLGGAGVDGAIHAAAGPALLAECRQLPEIRPNVRCETSHSVITGAGLLGQRAMRDMNVERIIHAVGPRFDAGNPGRSADLLKETYLNALNLAHANGIRSIAFPAISTGIFGYLFEPATKLAMQTIEEYAAQNPGRFDEIKLLFIGDTYARATGVFASFQHQGVRDNFMQV